MSSMACCTPSRAASDAGSVSPARCRAWPSSRSVMNAAVLVDQHRRVASVGPTCRWKCSVAIEQQTDGGRALEQVDLTFEQQAAVGAEIDVSVEQHQLNGGTVKGSGERASHYIFFPSIRLSSLDTDARCQALPRNVGTPRLVNSARMPRTVVMPSARNDSMIGRRRSTFSSALS